VNKQNLNTRKKGKRGNNRKNRCNPSAKAAGRREEAKLKQ
jgi:hypothetical protein